MWARLGPGDGEAGFCSFLGVGGFEAKQQSQQRSVQQSDVATCTGNGRGTVRKVFRARLRGE